MTMLMLLNLTLFAGLLIFLIQLAKKKLSLARQVFTGLVAGTLFGFFLQFAYGGNPDVIRVTLEWTNVVGGSYVNLLRMIIMPLILVTMIAAVLKIEEIKSLGKMGGSVIGVLVFTTVIAALVGILMATVFGLTSEGMEAGAREMARAEVLESRRANVANMSMAQLLVSFVPANIFSDLTDARNTSIIAVVIFGMFVGFAALLVNEENPEQGKRIKSFIDSALAVIMKLVRIVMSLTPYGVMALMTNVIASSNGREILQLINFVIASYLAIAIMFAIHSVFLMLIGVNVRNYYRKVWPVLAFAFTTRSSAATIPLTIRTQIEDLNVPAPVASMAATFGATIGQNGCAGIYPAMLAVMVAPSVGINPLEIGFILSLITIVAIGSFGIAGVGGGATYAALVVLPTMGLPITIVALLISIEPLIDMARTALNVNGAITTGLLTNRFLGLKSAENKLETAPTV